MDELQLGWEKPPAPETPAAEGKFPAGLTPDNPLYSLIKDGPEPVDPEKEIERMGPDHPLLGLVAPQRYKHEVEVPKYLDSMLRSEVPWTEVEKRLKGSLKVDPEPYRQAYQLGEAKAVQKGEGIGTLEQWLDTSFPFASAYRNWQAERDYGAAVKRFNEGKATDADTFTIARHERKQEVEHSRGTGASIMAEAGKIPALLGEFGAGGKVARGIGGMLPGAMGRTLGATGGLLPKAAQGAAATPLVPSTWAAAGARNQNAKPDESTFQAYAPAIALAASQNAVLGQLQGLLGGAPITRAGRILGKTVVGMGESAAADAGMTAFDRAAKQVTGSTLGLDTEWGPLAKLFKAETQGGTPDELKQARKQAVVQFATFSLFSMMHSGKEIPVSKLQRAIASAKSPERIAEVNAEVDRIVKEAQAVLGNDPEAAKALAASKITEAFKNDKTPVGDLARSYADSFIRDPEIVQGDEGPTTERPEAGEPKPEPVGTPEPDKPRPVGEPSEPTGVPDVRYYRVPNYKKGEGESNFSDLRSELLGTGFAGKWFSKSAEGNDGYFGKGKFQVEFDSKGVGGEADVVEDRLKEIGIGSKTPMYMHPAVTKIRFRGSAESAEFAEARDLIEGADGVNEARQQAGLEPIRLEATEGSGEPPPPAAPEAGPTGDRPGDAQPEPDPTTRLLPRERLLNRLRAAQKGTMPGAVTSVSMAGPKKGTPANPLKIGEVPKRITPIDQSYLSNLAEEAAGTVTTGRGEGLYGSAMKALQSAFGKGRNSMTDKFRAAVQARLEAESLKDAAAVIGEKGLLPKAPSHESVRTWSNDAFAHLQKANPEVFGKFKNFKEMLGEIAMDTARASRERIEDIANGKIDGSDAKNIPDDPVERAAMLDGGVRVMKAHELAITRAEDKLTELIDAYGESKGQKGPITIRPRGKTPLVFENRKALEAEMMKQLDSLNQTLRNEGKTKGTADDAAENQGEGNPTPDQEPQGPPRPRAGRSRKAATARAEGEGAEAPPARTTRPIKVTNTGESDTVSQSPTGEAGPLGPQAPARQSLGGFLRGEQGYGSARSPFKLHMPTLKEFIEGEGGAFWTPTAQWFKDMGKMIFGNPRVKDKGFDVDPDTNPNTARRLPSDRVITRAAFNQAGARNRNLPEIATTAWAWAVDAGRNIKNVWRSHFAKAKDEFVGLPYADLIEAELKNPGSQALTPEQRSFINDVWVPTWTKLLKQMEAEGIKFYDQNGNKQTAAQMIKDGYFHRAAEDPAADDKSHGVMGGSPGVKPGFMIERVHQTQADAMAKGIKYKGVYDAVADFIEMSNRKIADHRLANDKKLQGVDLVGKVRGRLFAEYKDSIDSLKRTDPVQAGRLERQIAALAGQLATGNVRVAPAFKGKNYPKEVAEWLEAVYGQRAGAAGIVRSVAQWNQEARNVALGGDFSYLFLQMLPMVFTNPFRFARTVKKVPRALIDGSLVETLATKFNRPDIKRALSVIAQAGGTVHQPPDQLIARDKSLIGKLPGAIAAKMTAKGIPGARVMRGVGQGFDALYGRTSQAMTQILDVAKAELYLANEPKNPADIPRVVEAVENSLGMGRMEKLGMTPERAMIERGTWLAPSYYRAYLKLAQQAFQDGPAGHIARKQLGSLMAGVFLTSLAMLTGAKGLGIISDEEYEERLNPTRGKFLMVPIPVGDGKNLEVGFGGLWVSIARTVASSARYAKGNQDENPVARFYRGHAGTLIRTGWDIGSGKDYLGQPTGTFETAAKMALPLTASQALMGGEGNTAQRVGSMAAGLVGLRAHGGSESGEFVDRLRKAASVQFGKRYEDLTLDQQSKLAKQFSEQKPPATEGAKFAAVAADELRAKKLTGRMPSDVRKILKDVGRPLLPSYDMTLSVGGAKVPLTDKRRERYEDLLAEEYEAEIKRWPLERLMAKTPLHRKEYVDSSLLRARDKARSRLVKEK